LCQISSWILGKWEAEGKRNQKRMEIDGEVTKKKKILVTTPILAAKI
jgi:hypothetical protein